MVVGTAQIQDQLMTPTSSFGDKKKSQKTVNIYFHMLNGRIQWNNPLTCTLIGTKETSPIEEEEAQTNVCGQGCAHTLT